MRDRSQKFHNWTPASEDGMAFHQGRPELRGRHDLARPVYLGFDKGVPVVFWSRRPQNHCWGPGDTIQGALDAAPWRVLRRNGLVVTFKNLWR